MRKVFLGTILALLALTALGVALASVATADTPTPSTTTTTTATPPTTATPTPTPSPTPGIAVKIAFTTSPAYGTAGQALFAKPVIAIQDGYGTTINMSAPITMAITPRTGAAGAKLGGTTTVNTINGIATFNDLSIDLPGKGYLLTATTPNLPPASSGLPFDVVPAPSITPTPTAPASSTTTTTPTTSTTTSTTPAVSPSNAGIWWLVGIFAFVVIIVGAGFILFLRRSMRKR